MKNYSILLFILMLSIIMCQGSSIDANQKISLNGVVQEGTSSEERISDTEVRVTEIMGKNARSEIEFSNNNVTGKVIIEVDKNTIVYKFSGKKSELKEFDYPFFEGKIINDNGKFFELYVINKDKIILNIFEFNEEGDRDNPFTVLLDNTSSPYINTRIEYSPMGKDCSIKSLGYVQFGYRNNLGVRMQTIGFQNNGSQTDHITRLWTKDITSLSSQPPGTITKIIITKATIKKESIPNPGTDFKPEKPNSNTTQSLSFSIPYGDWAIPISLVFSSCTVSSEFLTNPHTVTYKWNRIINKAASAYYYTTGSQGILAYHTFRVRTGGPTASHTVTGRIWYEVIGNWREYFNFTAINNNMIYYY